MHRIVPLVIALSLWACAQIPPMKVPMASQSQRQAVVVDIDGTLTPQVVSICQARPGAADGLRTFAAKGYKIVYVTARNPLFQAGLPAWLRHNGFPKGSLHVAQTHDERSHVAKFKARILDDYVQRGWTLAYAYGDSPTDFRAYGGAGIPREHIFALRRRDDEGCQGGIYHRCLNGWREHLPFIEREVPKAN